MGRVSKQTHSIAWNEEGAVSCSDDQPGRICCIPYAMLATTHSSYHSRRWMGLVRLCVQRGIMDQLPPYGGLEIRENLPALLGSWRMSTAAKD